MKRFAFIVLIFSSSAIHAQTAPTMGLLSVHIQDEHGSPVSGMIVDLLRDTVPSRALAADQPVSIPAGRYQLQAASPVSRGDSPNRALSYPVTVDVVAGDLTSVVLPVQMVGDDLLATAVMNSPLYRD